MTLYRLYLGDLVFYQPGQSPPDVDGWAEPYLLNPGTTEQDASEGGRAPNHTIELDNRGGQLTEWLSVPPATARLEAFDGSTATDIFTGRVDQIELDERATITLVV